MAETYVISEPGKPRRQVSKEEYEAHVAAQRKARDEQIAKEKAARSKQPPAPRPRQTDEGGE